MNKELRDIVIAYVEKVGVEQAAINASGGIPDIIEERDKIDHLKIVKAVRFKFAILEYLYFHDDTESQAICLGKTLIV